MKLLILIILTIFQVQAKDEFLKNLPCADQVYGHIDALGEPLKWSLVEKGVVSSKLKNGGDVKLSVKGEKTLVESNSHGVEFSGYYLKPLCALSITKMSSANGGFTDLDLNNLLIKSKAGIIYVWSPHMSLSVFELVEMKKYAKKLKVDITVLMDLNSDAKFSKNIVSEYKLPVEYLKRVNSRKLEAFGSNIHFPSMVLYKNGKLIKRIPGFNGEKEFKRLIKEYL